MIKYEDVVKRISTIEKKKIKNEERIKTLSEENNILTANLKLLNQKKEMFEKMDQDLADLIPDKKKDCSQLMSTVVTSNVFWGQKTSI